jgi:hypothetical protein
MIRRLWSLFVKKHIVDVNPWDKYVDNLHEAMNYLELKIYKAETEQDFFLIECEIILFKNHYAGFCFDNFDRIVKDLEEMLSERIETVQGIWEIE